MKVLIKDVKVKKRLRGDLGDIAALKESIQTVGLINPIIINEQNELISGYRRYEACRQLAFDEIEARIMETVTDKVKQLDIEYHENIGRIDLTGIERSAYTKKRKEILEPSPVGSRFWLWLKKLWQRFKSLFR